MKIVYFIAFFSISYLISCRENRATEKTFPFYFDEKTMIINQEQNNQIEGEYITVLKKINATEFKIKIPTYFKNHNPKKWTLGWGNGIPLNDAGNENLALIDSINFNQNKVYIGKQIKGNRKLKKNNRIVFWNFQANEFKHTITQNIIDLKKWKNFTGNSISFGGIFYDLNKKKWMLLFQECDNPKRQIYGASSENLINWQPVNNGKPLLTYLNFKNINWAKLNFKTKQTPWLTDVIEHKNKYYLIFSGTNKKGLQSIGIGESKLLNHDFKIYKNEILKPGYLTAWNNKGCFNGKISKKQNQFILAYDGINDQNIENVGIAYSTDLFHWKNSNSNPVISNHSGWRSKFESSEPDYIKWKKDTILLVVSGTKKTNDGFLSHYVYRNMYKEKSGNVDDAQLGLFISTDNGKHFYPHSNNPVIINNYALATENEHMGGNIKFIEKDDSIYFFYQVKNNHHGLKYSIHLKIKPNLKN